ncbi:hypothetical protein DPMN_057644 [Dreissena polymorpha]|uniref:Uncharacterized protein n=1 Tax=Dreissena polymorpha TaxID=45954 RepID=A0A9D4C0C1_DREPO|nr:hypothetical protein DPMN_057644 [Dreissena polymorpha]
MYSKQTICSLAFLCSGEIHHNPGPNSPSSSLHSDYSHYFNDNGLIIMHLDIHSLRLKLDILEVEEHPYDALVLTELG